MWVGFGVDLGVGLLCIVLGILLWKKQMIKILHSYHYQNVKKKDVPAYSRQMGIGVILIGIGLCVMSVFQLMESNFWWIPMLIGFIAGFVVLHRAQMRYNGSWFS